MNDIRPPRPRTPKPMPIDHQLTQPPAEPLLEDHNPEPVTTSMPPVLPKRHSWRKWMLLSIFTVIFLGLACVAVGYIWYQQALSPVSGEVNATRQQVTIEAGSSPSQIGDLLLSKQLIRSKKAFDIYTRLSQTQNKLQAGAYRLSPAESTPEIVKHLVSGNVDEFTLTFYPGATLTDTVTKTDSKKVDVTTVLKRAGYSQDEISAALSKTYDHPLFADKPATANLEGYVYGETYNFASSSTVEDILMRTFDEYYKAVKDNNLVAGFKAQGLSLYEGITMASIIQREVPSAKDQKQVAQVFLKRYRAGMALGSDITAYYGADKIGEARSVAVDTPYNTRLHSGLPPGPIASPGLSALEAVANPADGDYLYFLSGDDDVTYFARTNEEHEANIKNRCAVKCAIP